MYSELESLDLSTDVVLNKVTWPPSRDSGADESTISEAPLGGVLIPRIPVIF